MKIRSSIDDIKICDFCKSTLFISNGFFTCLKCGLTSNDVVFQFSGSFKENTTQHARLDSNSVTTLGNQSEIQIYGKYKRLSIMQCWSSNEENSLKNAKNYISFILGQSDITNKSLEKTVLNKYLGIKEKSPKSVNVSEMIPILIFFFCKISGIIINEDKLREIVGISKEKFIKRKNDLLMGKLSSHLYEYKEYKAKKQRGYVFQILITFIHSFFQNDSEAREMFLKNSKKFFNLLWNDMRSVNNENNKAAIVACITLFYLQNKIRSFDNLSKSRICKLLNAKDSSVSGQIERWVKKHTGEDIVLVRDKSKVIKLITQKMELSRENPYYFENCL